MTDIDESLYSRQLYVLGFEAMKQMAQSDVLIVGVDGLGVEIAKDISLAGIKSVTLFDRTPVAIDDLGGQFFVREDDIGKPRDAACVARLSELNTYVPVSVLRDDSLTPAALEAFAVVVVVNKTLDDAIQVNEWTRASAKKPKFIYARTSGLFGGVFCDFGDSFIVVDPVGEEPRSGMISLIEESEKGTVTVSDDSRHGLSDGDYVRFSHIKGANLGSEPRKIKVTGPFTFEIGDTRGLGEATDGWFHEVYMPITLSFSPLKSTLGSPEILISDFAKFDHGPATHAAFAGVDEFLKAKGALPRPRNAQDADEVLTLAQKWAQSVGYDAELNPDVIKEVAFQARGSLAPMDSVIGAYVAQEVMKAASGKFTPTKQYLYFDAIEALPTQLPSEEDTAPLNSRYDRQIAIFGRAFQEKIQNAQVFLVGAGAIGCEMLKNWAMIGLATSPKGRIELTDLDTIEKSNLNRQFLFRPRDLGSFKSEAAARAVLEMNNKLNISTHRQPVSDSTESIFSDEFWESLDFVTNALDNVDARRYVDQRCVYYEKPLLESGTLGTKANVQVVLPHLTESYSSSSDPPEKSFPVCTIKNFPNQIEHTIAWAKEQFQELFDNPVSLVNSYLTQPDFVSTLNGDVSQLAILKDYLVTSKPISFDQCISWARQLFENNYHNEILQLLTSLPLDLITDQGVPFWSGHKKPPTPLKFDPTNELHMNYVMAAANLHAFNYGLRGSSNPADFTKALSSVQLKPFTPKKGVQVKVNDEDPDPENNSDDQSADSIISSLPTPASLAGYRLHPAHFEKDDDTNYHVAFITAASNLRAANYGIDPADQYVTKRIAGKIIPAIATTTSLAVGLVNLELYKLIDNKTDLEKYKNGFVNLTLPLLAFSEPLPPPKYKLGDKAWTLWDKFYIDHDPTIQELVDWYRSEHGLEVNIISGSVLMLFCTFWPPAKQNERFKMKVSELFELVSKAPIPPHVHNLVLEVLCTDADDEDVDVPPLKVRIR